jgi:hypothetical protein
MTLHLTHEQLCDLLLADSSFPSENESRNESAVNSDVLHEHLRACLICSAELSSLRDSLSHFHDATVAYARQEFAQSYARRSSIAPPPSYLSRPLYWAAAAVVFVAALLPLSMHRQQPTTKDGAAITSISPQASESDAALLADIDQKISADVPAPMEPLADPTAGTTATTSTSDQRTN